MPRPIRYIPAPNSIFEVTTRTIHGRFLLKPSKKLNSIIIGVIGRALELFPVKLHLFVVASNHIHFILSTGSVDLLASFMNFVNGNIAREAGRLHHWREKFWSRRYRAICIADERKLLERVKYLLSHGCKEALVARPGLWPGVNCIRALCHGGKLRGVWLDRSGLYRARRAGAGVDEADFRTHYEVELSPLPMHQGTEPCDVRRWYRGVVAEVERETQQMLATEGRRPLGVKKVLCQSPHQRPASVARSPAPPCHASDAETRKKFVKGYRWFLNTYRQAAGRLRRGQTGVEFPENCFPPPAPPRPPSALLAPG